MPSDTRLVAPSVDLFRGLVQMMVDADGAQLSASPPEQPARA
jgi:hypothetical protein